MTKRLVVAGAIAWALIAARPAAAQTAPHGYVRGFSGVGVGQSGSTEFGAAVGFAAAHRLRIGGEFGRVADVAPESLKILFDDPDLKSRGVTVTPRSPAVYGLVSVTLEPLRTRVRPYISAALGVARVSARLDVAGSGPLAQMIRDDRRTGDNPAVTRPLSVLGAGVMVSLTQALAANVGYRYDWVVDSNATLTAGHLQIGLTLGF